MQPIFLTMADLATNVPAQSISYYSARDGLHPMYIAINGITYQLGSALVKHDLVGGSAFKLFKCKLEVNGVAIDVVLSYRISNHQWTLISCSDMAFLYHAAQDTYTFCYPVDSFYTVPHTPLISRLSGNPTDVIATANPDGKLRLDYIRYEDNRKAKHTHKITYSHLRNAHEYIETYDCEYISDGVLRYITLTFDAVNLLWVTG